MINIYDYTLPKLEELLVNSYNQKKYRATQLYKWIYLHNTNSFSLMSDISKSFIEILNKEFTLSLPSLYKKVISIDGTIKLLVELYDGNKVETVLMRYNYGNVACISTQVGCNMGCSFCASGFLKKKRNLSPSEMIGQIFILNNLLKEEGSERLITHVVVMGTGEPFDNYENVLDFIKIINHPYSLAIGARHITVSTSGLIEGIIKYASEPLQINLAISLHAPNDEIRNKIMPISRKYPLNELINAIKYYQDKKDRRVTFEYILLKGINDSKENCLELIKLIKELKSYVNLIPYNEVKELKYKRSDESNIKMFLDLLTKNKIKATIRKEFGKDIDAACGMLRAKNEESK